MQRHKNANLSERATMALRRSSDQGRRERYRRETDSEPNREEGWSTFSDVTKGGNLRL